MNRIRLLPEIVANQIAAGEVVERPASVVKELVENSLDANATRISVEVQAGGRSLIRVTDDGSGMDRDDALLCLERHATSKVRRAEDLQAIATMGFRGEALPSIASVSRFTLTTREHSDPTGEATRIFVNAGRIESVQAAPGPAGTSIEVRQIFHNLPARRKFLRTQETERAHIVHYMTLAALAHPEVGFNLVNDQRMVWELAPIRWSSDAEKFHAIRERLRQLHGRDTPLIPVDFSADIEGVYHGSSSDSGGSFDTPDASDVAHLRVWGFIGAPGVSRGNREEQYLFVNRRPIENKGLNHALLEGYHTALMKGRFPVCCLFLEIDPAAVDVNIHPSKREVKFREEPAVRRLTARAVHQALLHFSRTSSESSPAPQAPPLTSFSHANAPVTRAPSSSPSTPTTSTPGRHPLESSRDVAQPSDQPQFDLSQKNAQDRSECPTPSNSSAPPPSHSQLRPLSDVSETSPADSGARPTLPVATTPHGTAPTPLLLIPLRLIGVIKRLYVLLESDRGLVLMDQHAAHERILFEKMLHRLQSPGTSPSQRLLLPETIELTQRDAQFLKTQIPVLHRLGVELREFGERTFLLDALPPFVRSSSPAQFARDLVTELQSAGSGINALRLGEDMIAKTVCRHAVKANDALNDPELHQLIDDLRACEMPYTCPHGRPTLVEVSWRELERKFGRSA